MIAEAPVVTETRRIRCLISKKFDDNFDNYIKYLMKKQAEAAPLEAHSVKEIRERYPNAYAKWDDIEDLRLKEKFSEGLLINELAKMLQRKPGAIQSRLKKLHLIS